MENFDLLKQYINTELKNRIEPSVSEDIDPIIRKALEAAAIAKRIQANAHNRRVSGRVAIVNRVRNDKIQMQKKESIAKGYKIVNGQAVKMTFTEMKRRRIAARIASKKRAAEMSTIERKRKISMNLRNARLG